MTGWLLFSRLTLSLLYNTGNDISKRSGELVYNYNILLWIIIGRLFLLSANKQLVRLKKYIFPPFPNYFVQLYRIK